MQGSHRMLLPLPPSDAVQSDQTPPPFEAEADAAIWLEKLSAAARAAYTAHPKSFQLLSNTLIDTSIPPTALLSGFPAGYKLYLKTTLLTDGKERKDKYLYGHPSKRRFASSVEFQPHLEYLIRRVSEPESTCSCKVCSPRAASGTPSSPAKSRASTPISSAAVEAPKNVSAQPPPETISTPSIVQTASVSSHNTTTSNARPAMGKMSLDMKIARMKEEREMKRAAAAAANAANAAAPNNPDNGARADHAAPTPLSSGSISASLVGSVVSREASTAPSRESSVSSILKTEPILPTSQPLAANPPSHIQTSPAKPTIQIMRPFAHSSLSVTTNAGSETDSDEDIPLLALRRASNGSKKREVTPTNPSPGLRDAPSTSYITIPTNTVSSPPTTASSETPAVSIKPLYRTFATREEMLNSLMSQTIPLKMPFNAASASSQAAKITTPSNKSGSLLSKPPLHQELPPSCNASLLPLASSSGRKADSNAFIESFPKIPLPAKQAITQQNSLKSPLGVPRSQFPPASVSHAQTSASIQQPAPAIEPSQTARKSPPSVESNCLETHVSEALLFATTSASLTGPATESPLGDVESRSKVGVSGNEIEKTGGLVQANSAPPVVVAKPPPTVSVQATLSTQKVSPPPPQKVTPPPPPRPNSAVQKPQGPAPLNVSPADQAYILEKFESIKHYQERWDQMDAFFATDDKTKYVLMLIRKKIELQAKAAPGEIYISKSIIDATKKRLDFYWESMKKPQSVVPAAATGAAVSSGAVVAASASPMKNASADVSRVTGTGSPAFTSKTRDQQTSEQSTGSVVKLQPTESRSKDATPSPKSSKSTPPAVVAVPKAVTVGINNTKKKSLSPASISTVDKNERKKRSAELSMNLEELKQLRLASLEALASSEKLPEPTASGFKNSTQITETTSEAVTDTGVDVLNGSTSPVQQLPTTFSEVDSPQKSQTKNDAIKDAFISRSSDSEQRNVVVSPKRKGSFEESESKQDQPHSSSELKSSLLRQEPTESTKPTAEHPQPIRHMSDTSSSNSDSAPIPLEKKRRLTSVPLHADTTTAVHSSHSKGFSQEQVNAGLDRLLLLNPKLEPPIPLADVQQLLPKMKNVEKIKTIVELLNAALTERLQKRKRSEVSAKSGQEQNEKDKDDNHESDRKRAKVAEDSVKNPLPAPIATGVAVGQTVNPLFEPLPVSHLPSSPTQSENAYDSFGLSSQNQADLILALGGSSSPRPSTGHQSATGVSADLASGTGVSFAPVITPSVPTFAPDPQPSNPYLSVSIPMPHDVELLLEKINRIAQSPLETLPRFGVFLPTNKVKPNEPLIVGEFVWVPVIICPTIKYNKISIQVKGQSPVKLDLEPISNKAVYWPAVVKNVCKTILDSSVCEVWKAPILVDELDLDAVALSQAAEPLSTGKHVVRQVSGVHELELLEFPELPVFMEAKHLVKKEQMEVTPEYVLQLRGAGTWEEVVQIDYIGLVFEKYLKSLCAIAGK